MSVSAKHRPAAIHDFGLCSSLGNGVTAAAAFRAGLSGGRALPERVHFDSAHHDEQPVVGHRVSYCPDGYQAAARLLMLGRLALEDLQSRANQYDWSASRRGLFVALPSYDEFQAESFLERLCSLARINVEPSHRRAYREDRTGVASALIQAIHLIDRGGLDSCIVGAIDSIVDNQRLDLLLADGKVKTADHPVGITPGESACFVLLKRPAVEAQSRATPQAVIAAIATAPHNPASSGGDTSGESMSQAILLAVRQSSGSLLQRAVIYADTNGSTSRAMDLAQALVRLRSALPSLAWRVELPAMSFGDTGVASGLLGICLAVQSIRRGYNPGGSALVLMASDEGTRATVLVERLDHAASM